MNRKILVIGEALIDDIFDKSTEEKEQKVGGSPLNIAVTASRLGSSVQFLSSFTNDDLGKKIQRHLEESNVEILNNPCSIKKTSVAYATLDLNHNSTYTFDLDYQLPEKIESIKEIDLSKINLIHFGSLSAYLSETFEATRRFIEFSHNLKDTLVSFDPNIRPDIIPNKETVRKMTDQYLPFVDILKMSDEDKEWIYGNDDFQKPVLTVITHGSEGAEVYLFGDKLGIFPTEKVKVVDTIGAGDSFMGALVNKIAEAGDKILQIKNVDKIKEYINFANKVAGITVSRAGANPPWAKEIR
ncbi:MAG: carbohydrate kinase [Candidatus Ancillula sp.]|jgi:fructokinase|nr:carbohydrate kinase [Candidatus Ancillula sp.]